MQLPLPWQQPLWENLAAALANRRFPHALILTGKPGMGKSEFARYLARCLLCESPMESMAPCGRCNGCTLHAAGSHPDYRYLSFAADEKTGKSSTVIKVDQIGDQTSLFQPHMLVRQRVVFRPDRRLCPLAFG